MDDWVLRLPWTTGTETAVQDSPVRQEWLVTNGLGGYASGTVGGVASRRYHGWLIAALPAPWGRYMMLNHLSELLKFSDGSTALLQHLTEFRLESGLPVWRYEVQGVTLEKHIILPYGQNSVHLTYRVIAGGQPIRLRLRPALHFRPHDASVSATDVGPYTVTAMENRYEITGASELPPLRLFLTGERAAFTVESMRLLDLIYRGEEDRGYDFKGGLWSPGYFRVDLAPDREATLSASTESWETFLALDPQEVAAAERQRRERLLSAALPSVCDPPVRELVWAADQFLIAPAARAEDAVRARAESDEARTVIAGYHWFTDWGRDTMISLEGLTLTTGRWREAGYILRTFAHYVRDGLLPNLFPEGGREGLYHTADATLWFFHAIHRYLLLTEDWPTLQVLLPTLRDIVEHHLRGTRFGIGVDPQDHLLHQGDADRPLTWMDAKVGDWIVTPRRGKAVEINALWYNALRLFAGWLRKEESETAARTYDELARRIRDSFNRRFWYADGGYLYDVIDGDQGDDSACRPNQLLAVSLDYPVLDQERWAAVVDVAAKRLLCPVGLRSLAPGHPDYKARYFGDVRARDAAYHQGTVWAWLIGPFIDAWLKVHPENRRAARRFLGGFMEHLSEACVGSVSEVFDAEPPFTPRGCVAQAWSVAEVLRCWGKTA
jgi:predicted glycogen debranching enzyme